MDRLRLIALLPVALCGGCGLIGPQTYTVAFYNATGHQLDKVEVVQNPEIPCGVLPPEGVKMASMQQRPIPTSVTLRWESPVGVEHQCDVQVRSLVRRPDSFSGVVFYKFVCDRAVVVVRPSDNVWEQMRLDPP